MATFKVGDRVRVIAAIPSLPQPQYVGQVGAIVPMPVRTSNYDYFVAFDNQALPGLWKGGSFFYVGELAPLTEVQAAARGAEGVRHASRVARIRRADRPH